MDRLAASILTLVVTAAPLGSALGQPGPEQAKAVIAKANADILAYYPAEAKAAGVEGKATITCSHSTPHGALSDCVLVSERPVGRGFGQAALNIAQVSIGQADRNLTPEQANSPRTITLAFNLSPPSIKPNLLAPKMVIELPKWVHRPSGDDYAAVYPGRAARNGLSGQATFKCFATKDGKMSGCSVVNEAPAGEGFGEAALKLTRQFQTAPADELGYSVEGAVIIVPIQFRPPRPF